MKAELSELIEESVTAYGESYRRLITDALSWLDAQEPKWELDEPLNRREFIAGLIEKTKPRDI